MLFSRRFALLPALFALLLLPAAHAQSISIYGTASPAYLNHLYNLSGGPSPASDLTGKWFIGAEGGVTLNFSDSNKLAMGLDFRGGPQIGTPGFATALAGFKVASKTSPFHLKPYGQLSVGWMEQRHTTGTGASTVLAPPRPPSRRSRHRGRQGRRDERHQYRRAPGDFQPQFRHRLPLLSAPSL
jgi:hypothetical protein